MNMFKSTEAKSPDEYIANLDEPRQSEVRKIHQFIQKHVPKHFTPYILSGMIGYGKYHYKYDSGREGDWSIIALSSRKNYISIYVSATNEKGYLAEQYKEKLPKASIGKSCIRFKKIEDIDWGVLGELIEKGVEVMGQI